MTTLTMNDTSDDVYGDSDGLVTGTILSFGRGASNLPRKVWMPFINSGGSIAAGQIITSATITMTVTTNLSTTTCKIIIGCDDVNSPAPASLAGYDLIKVTASVFAKSTNATSLNFMVARGRQADATTAHAYADMLTTPCTIDQNEYSSLYDAHQMVVDTTKDDILEGDMFRFDCDFAGTAGTGCWMTLEFQKP